MRGLKRLNLILINADTESTTEGYMSAFIASRPDYSGRFEMSFPPAGKKPTRKWIKAKLDVENLIDTIPRHFETTSQREVREYFDNLHNVLRQINEIFGTLKKKRSKTEYEGNAIVLFANVGWDLDVLKGIIFPGRTEEIKPTGGDSDLVQLRFGNILFRDFLRLTGFKSIKMAGSICKNAHKLDGTEVYDMTRADIPKTFEEYDDRKKDYIRNDVAVMDESLLIFLNQSANQCIQSLDDLPMTLTGFSRYRQQHHPDIINIDGRKVNSASQITKFRWEPCRRYILYMMDAYKGGYCGPNPHIQYQIKHDGVCFDAVSMYPDKMSAHRMLQITNDSVILKTERSFEEMSVDMEHLTDDERKILQYFADTLKFFEGINDEGFQPARMDSGDGIYGYIGTFELKIKGVRYDPTHNIAMMPFLSVYKTENPVRREDHVVTANGKVISGHFTTKMSCVDVILAMMCYDLEVVSIKRMLTMSWKEMLPVQKRSVLYGYKLKSEISRVLNLPKEDQREYWETQCGFNFESLLELTDEEFDSFGKIYKMVIKAIPNGEYGKTVEKPIKPMSWIEIVDGIPEIKVETATECMQRVHYWMTTQDGFYDIHGNEIPKNSKNVWPPKEWPYQIEDRPPVPETVKCNDYAAGASITMWARWQLISMMYIFFRHGFETWYCDTDSLFTKRCPETYQLIERFNQWKMETWKTYYFYNNECYKSAELGNLGQFEEDKVFDLFCTLGAKNYCILKSKDHKFKITIAGLNTSVYEHKLNEMKMDPELIMYNYYHPNIFIEPSACRKLVRSRKNFGFDPENGDWCGSVLDHYAFAMIATDSKFHLNNMRRCEEIQGKREGTYCNNWIRKLYLSEKGFSEKKSEDGIYEAFVPLEDRSRFVKGDDTDII